MRNIFCILNHVKKFVNLTSLELECKNCHRKRDKRLEIEKKKISLTTIN